ncbi:unnamed protein product [Polarella glacialis]|uniref:Peroxin-12 n=1 Tax=Polarella glacialis TaxID=89957 RepID=A0A813DFJ4_POLGL|nr:unnamed protein product [Polarella glacialis]
MAVSEGFLTSIYAGGDIFRPTFFELIAQEQLMDALRPAVRFVVSVLAERAPPWALPLFSRWETVYSAFLLLLEGHHLRVHGATFAEHFFGLRRQEIASGRRLSPLEVVEAARRRLSAPALSRRQQAASLAVAVLLPWFRSRCEERFREAEGMAVAARGRRELAWLRVYPWVHAANVSAAFGYRLLYLLEQTDAWSPWLHVLGFRLVRHFPEPPSVDSGTKGRVQRLWEAASSAGGASLWSAVYMMQFLQWWYQREHLLQPFRQRKVPPPPPARPPYQDCALPLAPASSADSMALDRGSGARLVLLPQDRTICALCHRVRRNPASSCSGYVFCYPCLVPHIQRFGNCPISGLPMSVEQAQPSLKHCRLSKVYGVCGGNDRNFEDDNWNVFAICRVKVKYMLNFVGISCNVRAVDSAVGGSEFDHLPRAGSLVSRQYEHMRSVSAAGDGFVQLHFGKLTIVRFEQVWMVLGISTLVSQTLDNMDGKQARRTGTSSPLGLMLDHGADALNVNLCSINVMALLQVGDYRAMCFSVWFNSCTSFFFATWEEYQTGSLYLGVFNGPTDGLLIVALSFFVTALAEDQFRFWDAEFAFGISRKFAMTGFYTVCVFGTVLGNLLAVKQAISGLRSERSTRMPFVFALLLTIPFCAVLLGGVLGLFCGWSSVFASEPRLFFWCLGLMFLILVTHLQLAHICGEQYSPWRWTVFAPASVLAISHWALEGRQLLVLRLCTLFLAAAWLHLAVAAIQEMSSILGVAIFSIGAAHHASKED